MSTPPPGDGPYDFDLAVSFAGEDRAYVEAVVRGMQDLNLQVFYDSDYLVETWGEELPEFFEEVYGRRSRYVMMFISRHYAEKAWAIHERRAALAKALEMRRSYVLPVRLDDTQLPGLRHSVGFLDARIVGQAAIISKARQKIRPEAPAVMPRVRKVPRDQEALDRLINERSRIWEYLSFGGFLYLGLTERRDAYRSHVIGIASRNDDLLTESAALTLIRQGIATLKDIIADLNRLLQPMPQTLAFGAPGEPGDPGAIRHLAASLFSIFDDLINWARYRRAVTLPNAGLRQILDAQAHFADEALASLVHFIEDYVARADGWVETLDAGGRVEASMTIEVALNGDAVRAHAQLIDRYRHGWRGDDD